MSPILAFVLLLFAIAYGGVAVFAFRHKLLGRLAYREAIRRRGQALLVVAGLMIGTATITAALVSADSVGDSSVDAFAYRNWGYVDLTVASSNRFFPRDLAARLKASPAVGRVTDGVAAGIEAYGSASDLTTRQGTSGVTLVGFDPAAQKPFGAYTMLSGRRTYGSDLFPGQVLLSRVLADKLNATAGDRVAFGLEGQGAAASGGEPGPVELRVAGIVKLEGPGGYTLSSAVFVPLEMAQRLLGTDQINVIRISVPGGIRDSGPAAEAAAPVLRRAVRSLDAGVRLSVTESKAREADSATANTVFIRALLIGMSALVVAAGAALVVNLIGMLAEERRSRMGVLRALGLKRRALVGLSVIEGAWYSLAAGVVGVFVGVGAGRFIAARFGRAFAEFAGEDFDFEFHYSLKPTTVVAGFAVGTFLTLLVVFFAARRTSRMTITAAIRNLPEPPAEKSRRPWFRRVRLGVFGLLGVLGIVMPSAFTKLVGGIAVVLVVGAVVKPRMSPRTHSTLLGLALAGLSFGMIAGQDPNTDAQLFFLVFVIAMLTAVFGLTILASANLHVVETVVGLLGKAFSGLRAMLRPPLAYLARRPTRTGLTTGVFAVIVGMLSLFAVFFVIFRPSYERFGNGYDVRVLSTGSASISLPSGVRSEVARSVSLPTLGYVGPTDGDDAFSDSERAFVPLFVVGQGVAGDPPVRLDQRDDKYGSDQEVWEAILRDPRLVVTNFGSPGQRFTLRGPDGPVNYRVIGTQPFGLMDGMFGTERTFAQFRGAPLGVSMLIDVKDQSRATAVARKIESGLFGQGVDADSVQKLLDKADRANRAFFSTIDVLMRMGLVVGILSLGIVALRIVVERRHVIGVLRALGYKKLQVLSGLMAEATVTATIGAVVGLVVGVIMGYVFYRQQDSQPGFGIDFASIGGVLGLIYIAVLLVTLGPAWRASRLPPAEAVRYTE
jgi:putative ABC transport system permease protein